ncbi:MAG TPA: HepT-like ribonuclease domain-containing protein [Bradyrhizobium sp.]|nr:HepT-like ribonuclease domain-containing protein [Bradyrhizobium sp.]
MPPTVEDRLQDILEAISEIEEMLVGSNLDAFTTDKMRRMATERYLEVICEAARRLTDDVKQEAPNIDWRKMIDFGNVLRHAYHATRVDIIWDIIQNDLPALKSFVNRKIATPGT